MYDKNISAGCAIAYGTWALTLCLLAVMWLTGDVRAGVTGLVVSALAATATIRTYFVNQNRMMRNAFELGRDAESMRVGASVRSMR